MDNKSSHDDSLRVFTSILLRRKTGLRLRIASEFLGMDVSTLVDILLEHADLPHVYGTQINQEDKDKFDKHFKNLSPQYALEKDKYFKGGFKYHKRTFNSEL